MRRQRLVYPLLHPIRTLQDRIDAWVLARVRRQPGPVPIVRRRVYIVPTRYGFGFAVMVMVMLLASMNYSNSMAFALTFLLTGLGLVCMHHTHGNLVNLLVRDARVKPVFVGEVAHFELQIDNPSPRPRFSIASAWPREAAAHSYADVAPQNNGTLTLALKATRRGWLRAPVFSVFTEYPLSLFHAWTWIELDMACLVYPAPASSCGPPPPSHGHGDGAAAGEAGQDEFAGLRSYRQGDPPRSVHWKSYSKLRTPMVKLFTETLEQELWLDWDAVPQLDVEGRLSQLARWVLDAEAASRPYGLRLPGTRISPGRGAQHEQACLRALALFDAA